MELRNDCTSAVIIRDGKILLGNRIYPEKDNLSVWNMPGGRCDEGETLEQTLIREIEEEIGVKEEHVEIHEFLGKVKGSWKDDILHLFICSIKTEPVLMEPEKFREWTWFKVEQDLKTHFDGEVMNLIIKHIENKEE